MKLKSKVQPPEYEFAKAAACAATNRLKREPARRHLPLPMINATAVPGMKVTVTGIEGEIEGKSWIIAEVSHEMDAGGFRSALKMEVAG